MKTILIILAILLIKTNLFCQKWDHIYGYPGTYESFKDMVETYDKGYLLSGSYEQMDGNWLIKTDINGNQLWDKVINWDGVNVYWTKIDQDSYGNLVAVSNTAGNITGLWPLIFKLNSCGEKEWCRVLPNEAYDYGWYDDVLVLENGDMLALAHFISQEINDWLFLDYIDSEGNFLWRQGYALQENHPYIRSCSGDGIKKYGDDYLIHGYCYFPFPNALQRPLYIMLDSEFNEKWVLPFGVNDAIIGSAFETLQLNDSVFMGVGVRRLEGVKQNSLIMYFNNEGEELGFNQILNETFEPGLISNQIHDIERINDTLFISSVNYGYNGTTIYPWGEALHDTAGVIYDYVIRSDNTTGWTTMVKTFDNKYTIGCGWDEGNGVNDIYLYKINENLEHDTVYPGNYTYDSLCPYQIQSGEIDISDCLIITDVGEVPTPQEYFASLNTIPIKSYPNPVNGGVITFELQNTKHHQNMEMKCFNVFGNLVHTETVYQNQGESRVIVSDWSNGMYIAIVYANNKVVGQCKFVVR